MGGSGRLIRVEKEEICLPSRMCLHRMKFQCQKLVVDDGGGFSLLT